MSLWLKKIGYGGTLGRIMITLEWIIIASVVVLGSFYVFMGLQAAIYSAKIKAKTKKTITPSPNI